MTQPVSLHRITTQYVAEEDRLRLSAQDEQNHIHLLWLTQRLANQLVSHLGDVLENRSETAAVSADGQANETSGSKAKHRQASQGSGCGRSCQEEQVPVMATEATQAWLVQAIDVTTGDKGLRLTFKVEQQHRPDACLTLVYEDLHQWMEIIYQQYIQGGWSLLAWTDGESNQRGSTSTAVNDRQAHVRH